MPIRVIEVVVEDKAVPLVRKTAEANGAIKVWDIRGRTEESASVVRILSELEGQQVLLDALQEKLAAFSNWRMILLPVEAVIPYKDKKDLPKSDTEPATKKKGQRMGSREELYTEIQKGVRLDWNYVLFVILSTIVAVIGLLKDNVAVVIGAMVIAPLLGPNLAFAFGAALGDRGLMLRAAKTNIVGLGVSLAIAILVGLVMTVDPTSEELAARTIVGFDSIGLALASGAAAVLSMTTGLSSALVGVMVAVALLPPAATLGFMVGSAAWAEAWGALLLLAVNIVCVNLAAQVVFVGQGISPSRWYEKKRAKQSTRVNLIVWGVLLVLSVILIAVANPE
ncbi:MAG: TIGR00341 family protein [Pseudomonadota bacterium]